MEQPKSPKNTAGAVALAEILPTLAQNTRVQARLTDEWGTERLESALAMMRAGKLEGDLGDDIHDFFVDEIENEAQPAWSGSIKRDDSYPIQIRNYEGVYFVDASDAGRVGYFLRIEDAQFYVFNNWWDVQEDVD